jgi:hypothetical protein
VGVDPHLSNISPNIKQSKQYPAQQKAGYKKRLLSAAKRFVRGWKMEFIKKKFRDIIESREMRRKVLYAIGLCLLSTMIGILLACFFYAIEYGW